MRSKGLVELSTMFNVSTQLLPKALSTLLETAIEAWDSEQLDLARSSLQHVTALAQEHGYL
jgi:hypothetical protein